MRRARWHGTPRLLDQAGDARVAELVWRKLREHELSLLEWFKLLPLRGNNVFRGMCHYPVRAASRSLELRQGYRITASANVLPRRYPCELQLAVGTVTHPAASRRRHSKRAFSYVLHDVTLRDPAEALVFVAGHETFHFLRHSRQIEGRNTEPSANRFGLAWLDDWRRERAALAASSRVPESPRESVECDQLVLPFAGLARPARKRGIHPKDSI